MTETSRERGWWFWKLALPVALVVSNLGWFLYVNRSADSGNLAVQGLLSAPAEPATKVALLIGNSAYETPLDDPKMWPRLPNPDDDVSLVHTALTRIGFKVTQIDNASLEDMQQAITAFAQSASGADVALFYYAGHGFEFDRRNYLVPTDGPVSVKAGDLPDRFVDFEQAANAISGAGTTIFMLDACRTVAPAVTITDAELREGFQADLIDDYDLPVGKSVAILYSTARGVPARDSVPQGTRYSPFAREVARNIVIPRVRLPWIFGAIRDGVMKETMRYTPQQQPYTYNSLGTDFVLAWEEGEAKPRPASELKPLAIPQKELATVDETLLAVRVLADYSPAELATLAEGGDKQATYLLGFMHEFGIGVDKDLAKARDYLETAARQGTPSGLLELAYFLERNSKKPADQARSLELFRKAAASGFAKGQAHYASVLMYGRLGLENSGPNYDEGLAQLRLAAKGGYPNAMYQLALVGEEGEQKSWQTRLEKLATSGDLDAHHWLCELGMDPTRKDYRAALPHCRIAALAGFANAQAQMALAAHNGWGRSKSQRDARHWLRQAMSDPTLEESRRKDLEGIGSASRR